MDRCTEPLTLSIMALLDPVQLQRLEEKYVNRTIKCVPDKFFDLCHMHLAFLLDLNGDKLEMLLTTQDEQKKRKSSLISMGVFKKKEKTQTDLFGAPLTDEGVCLMIPLINFLKQDKNICKEGIFRKTGNMNRMNTLKDLLLAHGSDISIDHETYSPYDVSCLLKEFLRVLPEPLLTDRHMEAHRQVTALGKHASTPEEVARFAHKKLSALQLLMLLLPSPSQKLILHLLRLLNQIADCPETKMTPATLGTIFAPIFFIDRNAEAFELCSQISQTAPAVSFMIEKAHELFHAPQELVIDLANYWNSQTSPCAENFTDSCQIGNSQHGRKLNTNICYIDRELSRCDDVAGNTEAELASLLAHVQSLPDTPSNMKLKKQILKNTTTPVSSAKKYSQTKSISASIKKRFPSLGRSKKKLDEISSFSNSSVSRKDTTDHGAVRYNSSEKVAIVHCSQTDHKHVQLLRKRLDFYSVHNTTEIPLMRELLESPTQPTKQTGHQRSSRTRHRIQHTSENRENSADCECSPPKQECKGLETCDDVAFTKKLISAKAEFSCKAPLHENSDKSRNTISKTTQHIRVTSVNPLLRVGLSPKNAFTQLENEITYLPHCTAERVTAPLAPNRDGNQVIRVFRLSRSHGTSVLPQAPIQVAQKNALETSF